MTASTPTSGLTQAIANVKAIAETLALMIGGLWAYYKFFKGRTFRPRLELTVSGKAWSRDNVTYLVAGMSLKNVGLSKLELSQEGTGLRVFSQSMVSPENATKAEWDRKITLSVFEKHGWIEPGETISDQAL